MALNILETFIIVSLTYFIWKIKVVRRLQAQKHAKLLIKLLKYCYANIYI